MFALYERAREIRLEISHSVAFIPSHSIPSKWYLSNGFPKDTPQNYESENIIFLHRTIIKRKTPQIVKILL